MRSSGQGADLQVGYGPPMVAVPVLDNTCMPAKFLCQQPMITAPVLSPAVQCPRPPLAPVGGQPARAVPSTQLLLIGVDLSMEDFCFKLQVGDIREDSSLARARLKHHPEPMGDSKKPQEDGIHISDSRETQVEAEQSRKVDKMGMPAPTSSKVVRQRRRSGNRAARHTQPPWSVREEHQSPRVPDAVGNRAVNPAWGSSNASPPSLRGLQAAGGETLDQAEDPLRILPQWHASASAAGTISEDGHIFTKFHAGPQKKIKGMMLSSLCILFEDRLRVGGVHRYRYTILDGSTGSADGVGFVFDNKVRRTNIQRMRSVFLNRRGQICIRNMDHIEKTPNYLPKLSRGSCVHLTIDLERAFAHFEMDDHRGNRCGTGDLSFQSLLQDTAHPIPGDAATPSQAPSGFFCAIVTENIKVSLH